MARRREGFTLIELLVVIAIIAILAAILFPVFMTAKDSAQQARCLNNLHQLGVAITRYTDDTGGWYPPPCDDSDFMKWENTWRDRIAKYIKNKSVFDCAAKTIDTKTRANHPAESGKMSKFSHFGLGYAFCHPQFVKSNFFKQTNTSGYGVINFSGVTFPSKSILIAENKDADWPVKPYHLTTLGGYGKFYPYHRRGSGTAESEVTRGGGNFLLADGHTKFMTTSACEANNNYLWYADKSMWRP